MLLVVVNLAVSLPVTRAVRRATPAVNSYAMAAAMFLKPYEPTSSPRKDPDPVNAPAKPGKQKLAFLLGGGPK
jgi:hypothetical protein